jgi:ribosomal subunit interface protein
MQIQVHTDHNIEGGEKLATHVQGVVEDALSRFHQQISHVKVHLSDQNGGKTAQDDKRCVMEARVDGRQPATVAHDASSVDQAVDGAASKLQRLLEHTLGRLHDHHQR